MQVVFANGSNVYKQLIRDEKIVEDFRAIFRSEVIKRVCINHSFSAIQTGEELLIHSVNNTKLPVENDKIIKVVSNDARVLVLDKEGRILKFELPKFNEPHEIPKLFTPTIEDEEKEIITDISCGAKLTVAYSSINGKLFNNTNQLNYCNKNIISIVCGKEHCLLLDELGNVYSFGTGSKGQLGHSCLDDEPEPVLIEALAGIKIIQIAAGGWHSCALSKDGDLYTWGWNSNGQLGCKTPVVVATPQLVDIESDIEKNVVKVAAGSRHTIILLDNKHLYGSGWNKYKQLRNDEMENIYSFTYLHDLSKEKEVLDICCGPWNSAVLCSTT